MKGYVQVYTGDGKGKTTAALGLALRAAGAGLRTFIGQFMKGTPSGELAAAERFPDLIIIRQYGRRGFIGREPTQEDSAASSEEKNAYLKAIKSTKGNLKAAYAQLPEDGKPKSYQTFWRRVRKLYCIGPDAWRR